ncbi:hypothetical protein [Massilia sp. Se16.2.3]|uniref:hypothetical protein n=1 Tax=Massilia sp. Se16.2.3 TaxID=2709303 RepID=UPI001E2CCCA8|nr:hypothetical protein [Massilia sp. Se16.2.3]
MTAPTAAPTAPPVALPLQHADWRLLGAGRLDMVATDRRHVVLPWLAQVKGTGAFGIETGVEQRAARGFGFILELEMPCNDDGHGFLLHC